MTADERSWVEDAMCAQRAPASPRTSLAIRKAKEAAEARGDELEIMLKKIKLEWMRIKLNRSVDMCNSRTREAKAREESGVHAEGEQVDRAKYTTRKFDCPRCGKAKETTTTQLRTANGLCNLHCIRCGVHARYAWCKFERGKP